MQKFDLHTHTVFSDGQNTPREMIEKAVSLGLEKYGISDHSFTEFDKSYCISREKAPVYRAELAALKEEFADRIKFLAGIEQDFFSEESTEDYDYVIGSVHYVRAGGEYLPVDHTREHFIYNVNNYFGGDYMEFAREYFESVGSIPDKMKVDIIGHFDLLTKFNEYNDIFDTHSPVYVSLWKEAADRLLKLKVPFEINTGAISRGCRVTPYPSDDIMNYLTDNGASFILSSDAHKAENICFGFDKIKNF